VPTTAVPTIFQGNSFSYSYETATPTTATPTETPTTATPTETPTETPTDAPGCSLDDFSCGSCCSSCTEYVYNSTFQTQNFTDYFLYNGFGTPPPALADSCVCLDISNLTNATISLTEFDDCAIVRGDSNVVFGHSGDDLVIAVGDSNVLNAGAGNDTLRTNGNGPIPED
jgi:hypothetical protein